MKSFLDWLDVRGFRFDTADDRTIDPDPKISRYLETVAGIELTLDDLGDYYDHHSVAEAVNAALAADHVDERFHAVATGDQDAAYLFATPAAVRRARDELDLPW